MLKKKYEVKLTFYNGISYDFETNSDVRIIITEEESVINIMQIKEMKVTERK